MRRLLLALLPLLAAACPSYTQMPQGTRLATQASLAHRSRQLAVSLYAGPFFRDARYRHLAAQPPGELALLLDPKGRPVAAGAAEDILPAGTPVRIREVQFPTAEVATRRSLLTPRHFTWVLVEVPGDPRPHVIVVRDDPKDQAAFEASLSRWLTQDDVGAAVSALPERQRRAVREKRLVRGMSADTAHQAWGWPVQVRRTGRVGVETWTFEGGQTVSVVDGQVESWTGEMGPSAPAPAADDPGR